MSSETRRRALQRAADLLGGKPALCERLHVGRYAMELWMRGDVRVPDVIFYQLVDMIIEDDLRRAAQDRRSRPRPDVRQPAGLSALAAKPA
jgi:hypothetical protein